MLYGIYENVWSYDQHITHLLGYAESEEKAYALTLEAEKIYNKAFNGVKLADVKQAKEDYKAKDNVSSFYYEPIKPFDLKEYEDSISWG